MTVMIIGGGASGVLTAVHLLRKGNPSLRLVLVEPNDIGAGAAYGTDQSEHILNVTADRMSAYPDDPDHFLRWVNHRTPCQPHEFVARSLYRSYLQQVLDEVVAEAALGAWSVYRSPAREIIPQADGAVVTLENDQSIYADRVVLAVGNQAPRPPQTETPWFRQDGRYINKPWSQPLTQIAPSDAVLLIGSGLTTIDVLLTLQRQGHTGHITAVSRHGRWPLPHAEPPCELFDLPADLPNDCMSLVRGIRQWLVEAEHAKLPWQSVMDALRLHTNTLWRQFGESERCRFSRHLMPLWNVARHRIPASSAAVIEQMTAAGRLRLVEGRLQRVDAVDNALSITIRQTNGDTLRVYPRWVINCTGPNPDLRAASPVLRQLFADGYITADPLGMGLDATPDGALIDRDGRASEVLYAVGPLRRGVLLESTAIHDIRAQAAALPDIFALVTV
ncbi:MAG: FAD/NAD(P)-binding protein [Anaerolineae bacterium]|jgi:uncharacterized NAD(P)/FAD-binding protein YdhS|nr:FAD/NAD(P)-binding protein [Anaerolineae bacterium]